MARKELWGCVLARKAGQAEEEVEEDAAPVFHLHHQLRTSHLLASPEGEYSRTEDLLNLSFVPEQGFLVARREAFVERMGVAEEAWGLSGLGLVGGL